MRITSDIYCNGLIKHDKPRSKAGRLDPRTPIETAICAVPRGRTMAVSCDDPYSPLYLKALHTLNSRASFTSRVPAMIFSVVKVPALAGAGDLAVRNAHYLIHRNI